MNADKLMAFRQTAYECLGRAHDAMFVLDDTDRDEVTTAVCRVLMMERLLLSITDHDNLTTRGPIFR